jgi:DNA-binding NarL/FixJ family response regulator
VLLAEDHAGVADSLSILLQDDFDIVGTVRDGQRLIEAARQLQPEVIVADIQMPGMSGLEALRQLRTTGDDVRVIFLTAHCDAELAAHAILTGAAGFVLKQSAAEELCTAIGEVLQGRIYLSRLVRTP